MRTILFLFALACRLQHTALFLAQVQSVHTYNRPTLPTYVSSQGRPIHFVQYILPSYTFRLPTLPRYLGTVPSLSVLMMIATQKWLCVPLRVRPSVSTCFEKKGPPVSPVDCVCWLPCFIITNLTCWAARRRRTCKSSQVWCLCGKLHVPPRRGLGTVATREKERRASLRPAPPRARPCVRVVD